MTEPEYIVVMESKLLHRYQVRTVETKEEADRAVAAGNERTIATSYKWRAVRADRFKGMKR